MRVHCSVVGGKQEQNHSLVCTSTHKHKPRVSGGSIKFML